LCMKRRDAGTEGGFRPAGGMECRRCGACCIALSISSLNKPAGARCPYLTEENLCALWGRPERPRVCATFKPDPLFCGGSFEEALAIMESMEKG